MMKIEKVLESSDGTKKFLIRLNDDKLIESVSIPQKDKLTFCISTQVGCIIGCSFCATGKIGFKRNLTSEEIVSQVKLMEENVGRPYSIVYMGMGEPMLNLENVIKSVKKLNNPKILNFSEKKITISTCGIIEGMDLLRRKINTRLAISLHATTDELRSKLMPINKKYDIKSLIKLSNEFPRNKKERVMIEYLLLKDVNDTKEDLKRLIEMFNKDNVMFNLLEYSETGEDFQKSENLNLFKEELIKSGFKTFTRESRGKDIQAACGQLAGNN
jgi:23S rRNA (adenine2503-C2)-methyltransferase